MPKRDSRGGTKQRILDAALELFSVYGYDSVSVEQIASSVGIKAPSLYKHFKSKQDIFDSIVSEMDRLHEEQVAQLHLNLPAATSDIATLTEMSEDRLVETVLEMVRFVTHDKRYGAFRRMLTIEQYRRRDLADRYSERYLQRYLDYHSAVFAGLMEAGVLAKGDPEVTALQYFSPILTAIGIIDRHPEREADMEDLIRRHIHQFKLIYERGTGRQDHA